MIKKNNTVNATQIPETQSYFRAATITERIADNLNEVAQHYSDVNIARQIWQKAIIAVIRKKMHYAHYTDITSDEDADYIYTIN